jgi:UDP-N-acetylmuramate dehydrogenase
MIWHDDFRDILSENRPLAELTTFRIGGRARWFFEPRSTAETARLLARLAAEGLDFRVLGGGANLLIDDGLHTVPIIHPSRLDDVVFDGAHVSAGAGASFPRLVADSARAGLAGCDVLAGIPGQVGGICAMNAGGRWGEVAGVVRQVELATAAGAVLELDRDTVGFSYRATELPRGVVTRVHLRLEPAADPAEPRRRVAAILKEKGAAQPLQEPSGGCIFVNPPGDSTGRIVERLGLKGERSGAAEISVRHGNFIVNKGNASFNDVLRLIETIELRVVETLGISLRREIKIWRSQALVPDIEGQHLRAP